MFQGEEHRGWRPRGSDQGAAGETTSHSPWIEWD